MQLGRRTKILLVGAALVAGTAVTTVGALAASSCFTDIAPGAWYEQYVCAAADRGIVTGYPDGTFDPEGTITRAEAAVIATRHIQESISHGQIVLASDGTSWHAWGDSVPSTLETWAGYTRATTDGRLVIDISGPARMDKVDYVLDWVEVCLEGGDAGTYITSTHVYGGFAADNWVSSSTDILPGTCETIAVEIEAPYGAAVGIQLSGTGQVDIAGVVHSWVPVDQADPTHQPDTSGANGR